MNNQDAQSELKCDAWILPIGDDVNVAIGEFELVHIIPDWIRFHTIPHAAKYCNKVFVWHNQLVPVFDLYNYISSEQHTNYDDNERFVCIIAYQDDFNDVSVRYGALSLLALPSKISVANSLVCNFPPKSKHWKNIILSCFDYANHGPTAIIDLHKIFSTNLVTA